MITPRRMDFEFTDDIPEHWADGNAMMTAMLAGLSASFPPGERYFIASVRHYADRVTDPELKQRIRGFIGQEANHTKEHLAFNRFLETRGFGVLAIERFVESRLKELERTSPPEENLARTAALEHMTAFMASVLLENDELLATAHPTIAAFWKWHAIEEVEHRSVAFDVYQHFVGDERLRVRAMATTTVLFWALTAVRTAKIMRRTGHLFDLRSWTEGFGNMFGRRGVFRKALPLYLAYYRRGFHPDEHDNREAVERAKNKYLGERAA